MGFEVFEGGITVCGGPVLALMGVVSTQRNELKQPLKDIRTKSNALDIDA